MKKIVFLCLVSTCIVSATRSQGTIQWQATLGGESTDILQAVCATADGGVLTGGQSWSVKSGDKTEDTLGGYDLWIVKLNSKGKIMWQNTLGGYGNDYLVSLHPDGGNGFVAGAWSESPASYDKTGEARGRGDYWLLRLDSVGQVTWQLTLGGDSTDQLADVVQTSDGGFLLGGSSNSSRSADKTAAGYGGFDFWIIRLDREGNVLWQKTVGGSGADWLTCLQPSSDGGFLAAGYSDSDSSGYKTKKCNGLYDFWVVKFDSLGFMQWQNTIGGSDIDMLQAVLPAPNGGYLLGGTSASGISPDKSDDVTGLEDFWVVQIDSTGAVVWNNSIGGDRTDRLRAMAPLAGGSWLLAGYSNSNSSGDKKQAAWMNSYDMWIVTVDSTGNILSRQTIGGSDWDELHCLAKTADGAFILGGYSRSGFSGDKWEDNRGSFDYWLLNWMPGKH